MNKQDRLNKLEKEYSCKMNDLETLLDELDSDEPWIDEPKAWEMVEYYQSECISLRTKIREMTG